jgi:hypothetical protein
MISAIPDGAPDRDGREICYVGIANRMPEAPSVRPTDPPSELQVLWRRCVRSYRRVGRLG